MAPVDTSVVIAVRNDAAGLRDTLDALARQTLGGEAFEVIVVDDASTDDTPAVAARADGVTLLRRDTAGGAYAARNDGVAAAAGRFIAITDAGCVPATDWLERGTVPLARSEMTVVAGRIAMPLGPRPTLAAMVDVVHHLDQERYVAVQGSAVTANILCGRAVFDRAGPFDAELSSGGDREWVTRACAAGADLVYCAEATVVHPPRSRAAQVLRKSARVARAGSLARARSARQAPASEPLYRTLHWIKPWNRERGRQRLAENGASPGRLRWLAVGVAQIALVQLPQAALAAYWDARLALRRRLGRGRSSGA